MLWGGLGWVLGGPIGAIIGYSLAVFTDQSTGGIVQIINIQSTRKHSPVIL